jgi:hypothetical protein
MGGFRVCKVNLLAGLFVEGERDGTYRSGEGKGEREGRKD